MHTWQMWGHSKSYVQHPQGLGSFSTATFPSLIVCLYLAYCRLLQELSYRKQIARQLRTQYVEGSNSVTLKSRLRITEGRWKRHQSNFRKMLVNISSSNAYCVSRLMWIYFSPQFSYNFRRWIQLLSRYNEKLEETRTRLGQRVTCSILLLIRKLGSFSIFLKFGYNVVQHEAIWTAQTFKLWHFFCKF